MPAKNSGEMEKLPVPRNRGKTHTEASSEKPSGQEVLLPLAREAEEAAERNLQHLEVSSSEILGTLDSPDTHPPDQIEHPRTPAPWSRRRTESKQLHREPVGNLYEESEISAAGGGRGRGNPQSLQTESILQVKKVSRPHSPYLKEPNRAEAADVLENFLGHFLTYLQECPERPYFQDMKELEQGNIYEYEKLLHPGEFEVMLNIPVPDCVHYTEVEGYSGLFYTVTLLRKSQSFPTAFLLEDGKTISPRNIMEEFWKHVDQFVKVFYSGWAMRLQKKKPNCPAVTLVMLDNQGVKFLTVNLIPVLEMAGQLSCVKKAKDLLEKQDLLPLMQIFYFVAKQFPGRQNKETWIISFSHLEKEILNRHSSPQACHRYHGTECCRKDCLKMLEELVNNLRAEHPRILAHLSSYHARTSFLHTLSEWKSDDYWKPSDVMECFKGVLANFTHEVATAQLPHFFLPQCNLFGAKFFPSTKLKLLWVQLIEKEPTHKMFTVSRKKSCSMLMMNHPDMSWPLVITLGLMGLLLVALPHITT